jgi:hypothetical protein
MSHALKISCEDLRLASEESPDEMDVIVEMLMDAEVELDDDLELTEEAELVTE